MAIRAAIGLGVSMEGRAKPNSTVLFLTNARAIALIFS